MSASRTCDTAVADQLLDRFVNEPAARAAAGVKSRSTLQSMIAEGLFPPPIRVSCGRVAWSAAEIAAWQKARIQARDDALTDAESQAGRQPITSR
jgi:predicted DNA-binding transcriptional regulator AlpA